MVISKYNRTERRDRLVNRYIKLGEFGLAEKLAKRPASTIAEWNYDNIEESVTRRELAVKIFDLYNRLGQIGYANMAVASKGVGQRLDRMKKPYSQLLKRVEDTFPCPYCRSYTEWPTIGRIGELACMWHKDTYALEIKKGLRRASDGKLLRKIERLSSVSNSRRYA